MLDSFENNSKKILDALTIGIILTDSSGTIQTYNKFAMRYFPTQKISNIKEIIASSDLPNYQRHFKDLEVDASINLELRLKQNSKKITWCNLRVFRLSKETMIFQIWDITRRKQIEEYFIASEEIFRSFFGFSGDGIVFINRNGKITE
jgi:PAS domain-containing protein